MPAFKINFATCRGLPDPTRLVAAMEEFGFAANEEIGVLCVESAPKAVFGTLVRRTGLQYQTVDPETHAVMTAVVEKSTLIPFGAFPEKRLLEVYEGSLTALHEVGGFFASGLGLPVVTDELTLDLVTMVDKCIKNLSRVQLKSAKTGEFAASSYMIGPYGPQFADSDHGQKFLEDYAAGLKSVVIKCALPNKKATLTLRPNACFSYSCHEDDQTEAQECFRKLL